MKQTPKMISLRIFRFQTSSQLLKLTSRVCSSQVKPKKLSKNGPSFQDFLANANLNERPKIKRTSEESHPYVTEEMIRGDGKKVYLDVHGCQMNVNDTEVVWSILQSKGENFYVKLNTEKFSLTENIDS